ncbi:MAG TPA: hypothetical protein PK231_04160 [Acidocella sp.]|nr:hypothetical protein [Acidocella sp.]
MIKNIDPTGPLPPADRDGRIELWETNKKYFLDTLTAFPIFAVAILSALCWAHYLTFGPLPATVNGQFKAFFFIIGISGIFVFPATPYLLFGLIFPRRLVLDDRGIKYRERGFTTSIPWSQISEITLTPIITLSRYHSLRQTLTKIRGGRQTLKFLPVFDVAPSTLANHIESKARGAGAAINIRDGSPNNADLSLAITIIILFVDGLASLHVLVPTLLNLANNPFMINFILHLPH